MHLGISIEQDNFFSFLFLLHTDKLECQKFFLIIIPINIKNSRWTLFLIMIITLHNFM